MKRNSMVRSERCTVVGGKGGEHHQKYLKLILILP